MSQFIKNLREREREKKLSNCNYFLSSCLPFPKVGVELLLRVRQAKGERGGELNNVSMKVGHLPLQSTALTKVSIGGHVDMHTQVVGLGGQGEGEGGMCMCICDHAYVHVQECVQIVRERERESACIQLFLAHNSR